MAWKIENDCVLHHPVTGRPIKGKRIYSDNGYLVAEVYLCEEEDLRKIEASQEMYEALKATLEELSDIAENGVEEKGEKIIVRVDSYTLEAARAALAKADGKSAE